MMDTMTIKSKFMTNLIAKAISKALKKKGYEVDLAIEGLEVNFDGDRATVHINAGASMNQVDLRMLLANAGLE